MFTFSKPRYLSKRIHPVSQKTEPSYQFVVQYHLTTEDIPISFLLEADTTCTVSHLEEVLREEQVWWMSFLQSFLSASVSYFSKPYTVQHLTRIVHHLLRHPISSSPLPQRIVCIPTLLELIGGQLLVHWAHETLPVGIHIPDEEDTSSPVLPAPRSEMEEWDADAVPEEQATESLEDPAMLLEKQRVKEARLRAKLAVYRAQYQMNRFQNKYGQEVSDSESDSEEEAEDEDEEVDSLS